MRYKCKECKTTIQTAVTKSGIFIAVDDEPTLDGNLALNMEHPTPQATFVSDADKERLRVALDGAPVRLYKAHQCSGRTFFLTKRTTENKEETNEVHRRGDGQNAV